MDKIEQAKEHFLMALDLQQRGDLVRAEAFYRQALDLAPGRPSVMINLTAVLLELGKYKEAQTISEKLVEIEPENPVALLNLGNCRSRCDSANAALIAFDEALKRKPDYVEALVGRSGALVDLDRTAEALANCDEALAIQPDCVEALVVRGIVLRRLKRFDDALTSLEQALRLRPECIDALTCRSNVLVDLNRGEEALFWSNKALELRPRNALLLSNLGVVLYGLRRNKEALDKFDAALSVEPDNAEALFNRGKTLTDLGRHEDATASYENALALNPGLNYLYGALFQSRMNCCDWRSFVEDAERVETGVRAGKRSVEPFIYLSISGSGMNQLSCSKIWTRDKFPIRSDPVWLGERYTHDRIRLAYLSSDFCDHPVSVLTAGLFELHDRARFETTAISFGPDDQSAMRARLKGAFEHFIDVGQKDDREVARLIRDLEIDIAVDLNGHTKGGRMNIFAQRPAPIQVTYLGYPGTTGAEYIDYLLADCFVVPDRYTDFYSENVVRLPDCFQVNDFRRIAPAETTTRGEMGLPESGVVFCCANNPNKIVPEMFDAWMRILQGVPASVLWLTSEQGPVLSNLRKEATDRRVDPRRIVFAKRATYEQYLARYRLADIFLDTLPFNGGTTASDALWAGLPVLTCAGQGFAARMAGSLLGAVGLNELITDSLQDYEALALQLARSPDGISGLKQKLRSNRHSFPLFDTDRFRKNLEKAYAAMWHRFQKGQPPASFDIEAYRSAPA